MVLLVIADHASDDGTNAYPSQATIAAKASISVRTVQRCINNLVRAKYLIMDKHAGGSANCRDDRRPHLYTINLDRLRGDNLTGRNPVANGATMTPSTGRQSGPKNHTIEPSLEPSAFDEFWKIYPLKVGKQAAFRIFERIIKNVPVEVVLSGAKRYADDPNRHPSYTAHPSTWLNQGRWADEALPPRELTAEEKKAQEAERTRERERKERERSAAISAEFEEQKQKAVPMPDSVKELLRKTIRK